jgi:hypothetical protein
VVEVAMNCTPQELAELLNPIIYRELATIGAIDSAMMREDHPGYVVLMRSAKSGKQANIEQMTSMLRMEGLAPVTKATAVESLLKMQTVVAEWLGTTPTLRAMRYVEAELVAHYEPLIGQFDGVYKQGIEKCWRRARKHLMVLTAHLAKRGVLDLEEQYRLSGELEDYFAHDEPRVCMRCLFDRPGDLAPLERDEPHPYQYICSACHREVLGAFPPDIAVKASQWEPRELESRILEKALSRPSKLTAESIVLAKLSGVAPDMPQPPSPYKSAVDVTGGVSATQPAAETFISPPSSLDERLYTELLFDYESVRENW